MIIRRALALFVVAGVLACGDRVSSAGSDAPVHVGALPRALQRTTREASPAVPVTEITDQTFLEGTHARDPFRVFARSVYQAPERNTWNVALAEVPLDALRLTAVLRSETGPYAMVTTPTRDAVLLRRGMYVGHEELVSPRSAHGAQYAVYWRVSRIELSHLRTRSDGAAEEVPARVTFERRVPADGEIVERVLALAPDGVRARVASLDARLRADRLTSTDRLLPRVLRDQ